MSNLDYTELDQVDQVFQTFKQPAFNEGGQEFYNTDGVPQSMPAGDGQIQPMGYIDDGAITNIAQFAASIRPPVVVTSLPALPDSTYPQGSFVFLTTDEKLYRNTDGSTWSKAVDGADIVANSITAGQIAAGAIGTTQLAAGAVIANVANVGGTVTIDSTGITITNGALTIKDEFGSNVITGGGFGSSWYDFITSGGFYNAAFIAGTASVVSAITEVSGADSEAHYQSSLSTDIPYWAVSDASASPTGTFQRLSDANAPSGMALEYTGPHNAEIFQDIPVSPGQFYEILLNWKRTVAAGSEITLTVSTEFRSQSRGLVATGPSGGLSYTTSASAYSSQAVMGSGLVPAGTRYLRVFFAFARSSGTGAVSARMGQVTASPLARFSTMSIQASGASLDLFATPYDGSASLYPNLRLTTSGSILFGPAGTSLFDVALSRVGVTALTLGDNAGGPANFNLYAGAYIVFDNDAGATARLQRTAANVLSVIGSGGSSTAAAFWVNGGIRTRIKSGTISDADWPTNGFGDGCLAVDVTNHRLYMREAGAWHYIARTAGFEIPAIEDTCPSCGKIMLPGEEVIGHLDRNRPDGAIHGLWKHLSCAGKPLDMKIADAYHDHGEAIDTKEGKARHARALRKIRSLKK